MAIELYRRADMALPSDVYRASRAMSRYQAGGQVRQARINTEADVALTKLDALTEVTGTAMAAAVRVARAQRDLEQLAPEANGRLAYLADDHLLGLGEILAGLRAELRRL